MSRGATDAMRAEHALLLVRQGNLDVARGELAMASDRSLATVRAVLSGHAETRDISPLAAAVLDALNGRRDVAARMLAQINSPVARGDAGLLLWQLGREAEARSNLAAAHAALPHWNEVTIALGETALHARRFDEAIDL